MSFWTTTDGDAIQQESEYEAPSSGFDSFPDKTDLMAYIDEIKWQEGKPEYGGGRYVNYRICVTAPEIYKNRKSYFKLWIDPNNPNPNKTGDAIEKQINKDKRILGAIATNSGGGLFNVQGEPTDDDFARELTQKPMVFKLGLWEMDGDNGEKRSGNYVLAVSPPSKGVTEQSKPPQQQSQQSQQSQQYSAPDIDDDIPF